MLTAAFVSSLFAGTEKPQKIVPCPALGFIIIMRCISKGICGFLLPLEKSALRRKVGPADMHSTCQDSKISNMI